MKFTFFKKVRKWIFIKKKDVQNEKDLFFYHSKKIFLILTGFLLLSFTTAMMFISLWKTGEVMVSVPDVTNKPLVEALVKLEHKNLKARVKTVLHTDKPEGIIVSQDPKGGFMTKEKRNVMLFVNQPIRKGDTPNLIGQTPTQASKTLSTPQNKKLLGRIVRVAYGFSEDIPAGTIMRQTPAPGTPGRIPLYINVLVSKGKPRATVTLPNLAGRSAAQAARWLAINDITVRQVTSGAGASGQVVSHSPSAGTQIKKGSLVVLTIGGSAKVGVFDFIFPTEIKLSQSNIKKTAAKTDNDELLTTEQRKARQKRAEDKRQSSLIIQGTTGYNVKLIITVNGTSKEIYSGTKKPSDRLLIPFSYSGSALLEMYINGKKFIERKHN